MKMVMQRKYKWWVLGACALAVAGTQAQTIDKMKLTDGSLTCAQLYAEAQQMDQVMRTGSLVGASALPVGSASNPYGINTQAIAAQAQAAGQQLAQDPQVMALAQQYAAKAQAGTLTPQEQQQYAMLMMQNPAVQQQMQALTGNVLGQMQSSGAINQATAQAMQQGMSQVGNMPYGGGATNMNQAMSNAPSLGLLNQGAANANTGTGGGAMHPEMAQMRSLMLQSRDPKIRAGANDPTAVAQFAVILKNPNIAQAVANAQRAGVGSGVIQAQVSAATSAQLAAWGATAGSAGVGGASGLFGQTAAPAAPAVTPTQQAGGALGGLFGALAAAKGGGAGGQQTANMLGSLFASAGQQAAAAPATPVTIPSAGGGNLAAQAQARKEHLTGMFLSKGCKLSDVAR